jgi:hypothetical protein
MHLSDDEIEQLLAARLEPARQQRVVRHLLAGCGGLQPKAHRTDSRPPAGRILRKLAINVQTPEAAAHVALDLLPLVLRQGKQGETRQLAKESHGILRDVGHHSCAGKARVYL